jgi:ABC-2 type transport system permease protein
MPLRMANGVAAPWEVALSVAIVVAATAALVPVAGRVYRGGALETRRQVRLRQAWRGAE